MALETSQGSGFLAALFPPGNLAAETIGLRREILLTRDGTASLPFPCAAALAWFGTRPESGILEDLAAGAPRLYDRYRVVDGILYLGSDDEPERTRFPDAPGSSVPISAGAGFPLVRLYPDLADPPSAAGLPPPLRIAFRTFQAVLLRLSWGDPWFTALSWESLAAVRYPIRTASGSGFRIPRNP